MFGMLRTSLSWRVLTANSPSDQSSYLALRLIIICTLSMSLLDCYSSERTSAERPLEATYTHPASGRIPEICANTKGLTPEQLRTCKKHPEAVVAVSKGTRKGIRECQNQFRNERWNCTPEREQNIFSDVLKTGSRETAFFYAITSSGVVHALAHACTTGSMLECSCHQETLETHKGWKWSGCSDNINFAMKFARQFVDAPEKHTLQKSGDLTAVMNLHNNRAGRLAVKSKMVKHCRCHGVSGTCGLKTCWYSLPTFSEVGELLKTKYQNSVQLSEKMQRKMKKRAKRISKSSKPKRKVRALSVDRNSLVHINSSPDYCTRDPNRGILGTSGRQCNKTSDGPESCEFLCCGRGYNTQVIRRITQCQCHFFWCCEVRCKLCNVTQVLHTCK